MLPQHPSCDDQCSYLEAWLQACIFIVLDLNKVSGILRSQMVVMSIVCWGCHFPLPCLRYQTVDFVDFIMWPGLAPFCDLIYDKRIFQDNKGLWEAEILNSLTSNNQQTNKTQTSNKILYWNNLLNLTFVQIFYIFL